MAPMTDLDLRGRRVHHGPPRASRSRRSILASTASRLASPARQTFIFGRARVAGLAVLASIASAPTAALAQPQATDRVLAEALFREGRELLDQEKVTEACAKFADSYRLDHALGTLVNLAFCHEKEGKTATAWAEFSEAGAEAAAQKDDRETFAKKHAAALALEMPRVRLVIAPATSALESLDVKLDGHRIGRGLLGSTVPLDPGRHDLATSAEGKLPYHFAFDVKNGSGVTDVHIPPLADAPRETEAPLATSARDSSGSTQRTLGWVVAAVGLAGVGVGGGFGLRALSLKDDRDDRCDSEGRCSAGGVAKDESARESATISTIATIGGAAFLAGGIVLVLTAPSGNVRVGTAGRGLFVGGTF